MSGGAKDDRLRQMFRRYAAQFPLVQGASRADVENSERVVLVDVRTAEEQHVSRIPGSVTKEVFEAGVASGEVDLHLLTVVPYCTIGYRSGLYAEEVLHAHPDATVLNSEGILLWLHDGGVVVEGGQSETTTQRVHCFGLKWALAPDGYEMVLFSTLESVKGGWGVVRALFRRWFR